MKMRIGAPFVALSKRQCSLKILMEKKKINLKIEKKNEIKFSDEEISN